MASTASPEPEPEAEVEPQSEVEPVPEWTTAFRVWGPAWQIHWIGCGCLFFLLALYCLIVMLRLRVARALIYKKYFLVVNFLMVVLGVSRALYLWINPYETYENVPKADPIWPMRIIFVIGFPCETSAFCLIQFVLLEISKVQITSPRIQNIKVILSIIVVHFLVAIAAEAITVVEGIGITVSRFVWMACQIFFIIWGFLLCIGFLYAGGKIIHNVRVKDKYFSSKRSAPSQTSKRDACEKTSPNRTSLKTAATTKVARVTTATACLGLGLTALQIYSLIAVYELYRHAVPRPWPWWSYQTCFRLLEFLMGCTIAYSVSQKVTKKERKSQRSITTETQV